MTNLMLPIDFIGTPDNATVFITANMDTVLFGDFRCATRQGYKPVWLVNGVSIDIIEETAGYSDIYTEVILLPVEGNVLSFLSIPATPVTNNSVVICTAITTNSQSIVAYSIAARLTVLQGRAHL